MRTLRDIPALRHALAEYRQRVSALPWCPPWATCMQGTWP